MTTLVLTAPLQGWLGPLDEAPDPVFSQRMLGDGVAIDPTLGSLHAPCAAEVLSVHHTRHSVALRAAVGAEILIHVGLETVALGGEGFECHVRGGQVVQAGDLLITFDMDLLARRARSLLTPIVITNGDAFAIARRAPSGEVKVGDFLMELASVSAVGGDALQSLQGSLSREVTVSLPHGIHARPAAQVAAEAKRHAADIVVSLTGRTANAKSPVAVMALGVRAGDVITLSAGGVDAQAALDALADLITHGIEAASPAEPERAAPTATEAAPAGAIRGVGAAPGLAIGSSVRITEPEVAVREASGGPDEERALLTSAVSAVKTRIELQVAAAIGPRRAILEAHLAFLEDPELGDATRAAIERGSSAGMAWRRAVGGYVDTLRALDDDRMAERAGDLLDLERLVLLELAGDLRIAQVLPDSAILLADDLLPSQLMTLDAGRVAGFCLARGGPTSHVAILASAMNIPAVVAAGPQVLTIEDGAMLILDGDAGALTIAPGSAAIEAAQSRLAARQVRRRAALSAANAESRTIDGERIEVLANVGSLSDASAAAQNGAEGCGLLRTEFLFLERETAPDEDEQAAQYQAIAGALAGRPLVVRTLDVGGDKAVPYLPMAAEDNPALGLRGVRVSLWRRDLLRTQLRAILSVRPFGQCRIMLPMITSVGELRSVRAMVDELRNDLGYLEPIQIGVMVETPAAALTADLLGADADFLSIGTNDLAQYVLAMDRGNPALAAQVDALHPAVLRLIARTVEGAAAHGRPVSVCGALASDPAAVPILIGLGAVTLSVTPAMVPEIKALIRTLTGESCRELALRALGQTSADAVRSLTFAPPQVRKTGAAPCP